MKLLAILIVTAVAADAGAAPVPLPDALSALASAAKCDDARSPWRPWCIAATGWRTGGAAALPTGKVLVGVTIELETGGDVGKALSDRVSLSSFAVGSDGRVTLATVMPENDDERQAALEGVFNVASVLKGRDKVAKLPKALAEYVGGRKGKYATTKTKDEWTWEGASPGRARKVGTSWVVIETAADGNGYVVTVLTEAWQ